MHGLAYILNLFFLNCSISWPINKEAFIIHVLLMCTNYISVFWWVCKELQNSNLDQEIYMGLQCIVATKLRGIKKTWRRNYKSVWKIFLNNSQDQFLRTVLNCFQNKILFETQYEKQFSQAIFNRGTMHSCAMQKLLSCSLCSNCFS